MKFFEEMKSKRCFGEQKSFVLKNKARHVLVIYIEKRARDFSLARFVCSA